MDEKKRYKLPVWAPRISKLMIERLYRSSAKGFLDEELIDEVGYGLYARCESMLEVSEIQKTGRPKCPECEEILPKRNYQSDEELSCSGCGWTCPAHVYNKTYSRKNFGCGGLENEIREFMRKFRTAFSYGEKLVQIDTLIHRFHWASEQGRPLATALIEGRMKTTMAFLDRLSYGDAVPEEVHRTREKWRHSWKKNRWSHGKGQ